MLPILKTGSRGDLVADLQRKLNHELKLRPPLADDGKFGTKTDRALKQFQRSEWLVVDGDMGPCTYHALYGHETYTPILHKSVPFISQPDSSTCWAAATAMMTNGTVAGVTSKTPSDMYSVSGGLFNESDTNAAVAAGNRFGRVHGLRCNAPQSWTVMSLRAALRRGPLMFDMLWSPSDYASGAGSAGHMIVVTGIRGDDDGSGRGTTLRIHDPWPPGRGARYSVGYQKWMREVPTRTYRVFETL